jgi:hypothetical protein
MKTHFWNAGTDLALFAVQTEITPVRMNRFVWLEAC